MPNEPCAFLDTSVLFAAVLSETGGARLILKLGEAGVLRLRVGPGVLREADDVLARKAPKSKALFALLGFECIVSLYSVVENPTKNVPRAFMIAILFVGGLYLFFTGGIFMDIPGISIFVVISHIPSCISEIESAKEVEMVMSRSTKAVNSILNISIPPF